MARIVLGIASSHGPMLSTPPDQWGQRVAADKMNKSHHFRGKVCTFDELVELRKSEGLAREITPEKWQTRHAACRAALARLREIYEDVNPDVALIIGNDQMEVFTERTLPAITVFRGPYVENIPYTQAVIDGLAPGVAISVPGFVTPEYTRAPGHPELADHLIRSLMAEPFDVATSTELPEGPRGRGVPHAFGFIHRQIMGDRIVPHVPIFINTFYPPNQPTAKRCLDFGRALARAVRSWPGDAKVALLASGGLSHFVIDETFDRQLLADMKAADFDALARIPEPILQAGTSEVKNWIPVAGAMAEAGASMHIVDYVPCYRSEAGTGNAMGFAYWQG